MNPKERLNKFKNKTLFSVSGPGYKKSHDGFCFYKYICSDESHKRFKSGLHVLICDKHKNGPENVALHEDYKAKYRNNLGIASSFHVDTEFDSFYKVSKDLKSEEVSDVAIYMLQIIEIQGKIFNLFF